MPYRDNTRNRSHSVSVMHLDIMHPARLTAASFEAAVDALGTVLRKVANAEEVLSTMMGQPMVFEVALSALNETDCTILHTHIFDSFPACATSFNNSIHSQLLLRLPLAFFRVPSARDFDEELGSMKKSVEQLHSILDALASSMFVADTVPSSPEQKTHSRSHKRNISQKALKRSRKASVHSMDPFIFRDVGLNVPETQSEADQVIREVLSSMRSYLQMYIDFLRRPEFAMDIRDQYLAYAVPPERIAVIVEPITTNTDQAGVIQATSEGEINHPPFVQPLRPALYFDNANGFGEWQILISTRASRDLRDARRKDAKIFDIYIKKIKELSNGMFSSDNQKRLTGPGTEVPIFEAKMTSDSRLVYQIDCISEYDNEIEQQVIRIFGIYTHAQLDGRFWESVSQQVGRKGKEYRRRCIFRNKPLNKGDYVVLPATFPEPVDESTLDNAMNKSTNRPEDLEELHALLVLEKFVTLSQALLNSIIADKDVQHVFAVSPKEMQIIRHRGSCFVLGRSGTGKTTTMLFKILGIQQSWDAHPDMMPRPRQIFVTQSRVLASKVEEYFGKLMESHSMRHETMEEAEKLAKKGVKALVDEDEEEIWESILPVRFSELQDNHFPLFVTYDRLCKLLENDLDDMTSPTRIEESPITELSNSQFNKNLAGNKTVSYDDFLAQYWSHFPQSLTKNLDPALVWSEFLGVIKGSEHAWRHDDSHLDHKTYSNLSHRSNSTFASQRDVIWKLFEAYLKRKRTLAQQDAADRTMKILRNWRDKPMAGQKIDFLYVDEAQDNLLIDALLLRSICRNPDGLFWAGDTAQTIANGGSAFRFDDLKSFCYRIEEDLRRERDYPSRSGRPEAFQLAVNYRSHGGIVSCASSVIRIVTHFWPYAIDVMQEEKGVVDGLKPVVFTGWDENTLRYEQFLIGEGSERLEFGAKQCILVRHDAARNKLRKEVGDIGVIMTLYESKGLEFDDVLLLNFFSDSNVDAAQWRVILNILDHDRRNKISCPRFDDMKHAGVCAELKFLYVAITRARKNLWIIDTSDKGESLRIFWTEHDLIQTCTPGAQIPRLAVGSTAEEWELSGRTLFHSKKYVQAMYCFERAGMNREAAVANAYILRDKAKAMPAISKAQELARTQAFSEAGDAFVACAVEAGGETRYYRNAGHCFASSNRNYDAGRAFSSAKYYDLSARYYRKGEHFDEAVHIVRTYKVDKLFAETLIDVAKFYYINNGVPEKATPLFQSLDEQLEYMEDADLDVAQASLLESLGRYSEAASVHFAEDRPMQGIRLLLSDPTSNDSLTKGVDRLLEHLWYCVSFGVSTTAARTSPLMDSLLTAARQVEVSRIQEADAQELKMFTAIMDNDNPTLRSLAPQLNSLGRKSAALLCLDHVFMIEPNLRVADDDQVLGFLQLFDHYLQLLRLAASEPLAIERAGIRRLFALSTDNSGETYLCRTGTHLESMISNPEKPLPFLSSTSAGVLLSSSQASQYMTQALSERARIRVARHDMACADMRAFTPYCLSHIVLKQCNTNGCTRQHIATHDVNKTWFTRRVTLHMQQILVLQAAQPLVSSQIRAQKQRHWLTKLYEVLYPTYFLFGSVFDWEKDASPARAIDVVHEWLRDLIYNINPFRDQATFLSFFMQAITLSKLFDTSTFQHHVKRSQCMTIMRPPAFMRSNHGDYILADCLDASMGEKRTAIAQGILFASFILEQALKVDICVLCDYLEFICASIAVDCRLRHTATLHNLLLPRSWALHVLDRSNFPSIQDSYWGQLSKLLRLITHTIISIDQVAPTHDFLYFEGRPLIKYGVIRLTFIARLCKALCHVAANANNRLRDDIYASLQSIRQAGRRPHALYSMYIEAPNAFQFVKLAQRSVQGSPTDDLVLLFSKPKTRGTPRELPGIKNIVYTAMSDLRLLLNNRSLLRPEAPLFIPRTAQAVVAMADDEDASDDEAEAFNGPDAVLLNTAQVQEIPEQEHAAARVVQAAYRTYRREKALRSIGNRAARRSLFDQLHSTSTIIPTSRPLYLMYYLGPLAHSLLVAEHVQRWLYGLKRKVKKQNSMTKHEDLEAMRARQTKTNGQWKRACAIMKQLEPTSALHTEASTVALRDIVIQLQELMDEMPSGSTADVAEDHQISMKGIVREPAPPQSNVSEPRPTLNTDDLDEALC